MMRAVYADQPSAARDVIVLNAGAAVYAAGVADSLESGVQAADRAIASGGAGAKFEQFVAMTQAM